MTVLIQADNNRVYIEDDSRILVCEDAEERRIFEAHEIRTFWIAQDKNRRLVLHIQDHNMRAYRYGPVDSQDIEMVAASMSTFWASGNVSRHPDPVDLNSYEPTMRTRSYLNHAAAYLSDAIVEIISMSGDTSDPRSIELRQIAERVKTLVGRV